MLLYYAVAESNSWHTLSNYSAIQRHPVCANWATYELPSRLFISSHAQSSSRVHEYSEGGQRRRATSRKKMVSINIHYEMYAWIFPLGNKKGVLTDTLIQCVLHGLLRHCSSPNKQHENSVNVTTAADMFWSLRTWYCCQCFTHCELHSEFYPKQASLRMHATKLLHVPCRVSCNQKLLFIRAFCREIKRGNKMEERKEE